MFHCSIPDVNGMPFGVLNTTGSHRAMHIDTFNRMPIIKVFNLVDTETGNVVKHEVRRDPETKLTLVRKQIVTTTPRKD